MPNVGCLKSPAYFSMSVHLQMPTFRPVWRMRLGVLLLKVGIAWNLNIFADHISIRTVLVQKSGQQVDGFAKKTSLSRRLS
jgi:hypothetical protein